MILILGVTASGKGSLALNLAKQLNAEIISVDSMKVYKRMDIGTAKPTAAAQNAVKYHLIDVVEPSEPFSAGMYYDLANEAIENIKQKNKPIIAVGGTALYIKALLFGLFDGPGQKKKLREKLKLQAKSAGLEQRHIQLQKKDPQAAQNIHPNDEKRIIRAIEVYQLTGKPISSLQKQWDQQNNPQKHNWTVIGLRRPKEIESKRINARVKEMIDNGLADEVKALLAEDKPLCDQASCAIGYAETIQYLNGEISLDETIELIKRNTRRFAKGQRTWFKTFKDVNWIDIDQNDSAEQILKKTKKLVPTENSDHTKKQ